MRILPPGVQSAKELDAQLKRYDAAGRPDAGFVPHSTTLVDGERIGLTFVVRNPGRQNFTYEFGGDYRGANRHNRFRSKSAMRPANCCRIPPGSSATSAEFFARKVEPNRLTADTLDLQNYRTFPGPGRYVVSARFELTNEFTTKGGKFSVPVETKFELTILPRTADNIETCAGRTIRSLRGDVRRSAAGADRCDLRVRSGRGGARPARLAGSGTTEQRQAAMRGLGLVPVDASLAQAAGGRTRSAAARSGIASAGSVP